MGHAPWGVRRLTSTLRALKRSPSGVSVYQPSALLVVKSGLMRRKPMRGAKSAKWVAGAAIIALAATACGGGDDDADKGSKTAKGAVNPDGIFSVEVGEP